MRILITTALLAPLALFQANAAQAADCKLQLFAKAQLTPGLGGLDTLPVSVNGAAANFLFDTSGAVTQISRSLAGKLQLPIRQGPFELFDADGRVSRDMAPVKEFIVANMRGTDLDLPIQTTDSFDGTIALDHLSALDMDIDFGTGRLNFFSPDHCEGQVVYWTKPDSVAIVPMEIFRPNFHVRVPVTLDGHTEQAIIDTSASHSTIMMDEEQRVFNLGLGSSDTPEAGTLNNDPSLKTYRHTFKTLSFGDVTVNNPQVYIVPNEMGRSADRAQLVGARAKSEKDLLETNDMTIGMDVLRKLHIYIAFKERKMYVSLAAAPQTAPTTPTSPPPAAPQ